MNNKLANRLRGIVDGTDRRASAQFLRAGARLFSIPYSFVVRLRNFAYDRGVFPSTAVSRPVISVGNLTMGGVGKTPFVAWLTELLIALRRNPGIISRGYRSKEQENALNQSSTETRRSSTSNVEAEDFSQYLRFNDEAQEIALRFPRVPYFVGANRVETANALLRSRPDVDAIILDDAFQHRRIARNLDIVLLDALNPFGGDAVAPAGYLREPSSGLSRADVVILSRADLLDEALRQKIRARVQCLAPNALWCEVAQRPRSIIRQATNDAKIEEIDFDEWRAQVLSDRFLAFCGLGAPRGFQETLTRAGIPLVSFLTFPDHCVYSPSDRAQLTAEANRYQFDAYLTTMKDFVKIRAAAFDKPLYALGIHVEFLSGEKELRKLVNSLFA